MENHSQFQSLQINTSAHYAFHDDNDSSYDDHDHHDDGGDDDDERVGRSRRQRAPAGGDRSYAFAFIMFGTVDATTT